MISNFFYSSVDGSKHMTKLFLRRNCQLWLLGCWCIGNKFLRLAKRRAARVTGSRRAAFGPDSRPIRQTQANATGMTGCSAGYLLLVYFFPSYFFFFCDSGFFGHWPSARLDLAAGGAADTPVLLCGHAIDTDTHSLLTRQFLDFIRLLVKIITEARIYLSRKTNSD